MEPLAARAARGPTGWEIPLMMDGVAATLILPVFGEPAPRQADSRARTSSITSLGRNGDT